MNVTNENKRKIDEGWEAQVRVPFQKAIKRSKSKISEIKSERTGTRVTSPEGKVFSPDCGVETGTTNDNGTVEVHFV